MAYNIEIINNRKRVYGFATYPEVIMYEKPKEEKAVQHLIFGDYLNLLPNNQHVINEKDGWIFTRSRGNNGWIKTNQVQKERILEINFVDIGKGNGCHIVTPDDHQIIIDAGEEDYMYRFLSWRYNLRKHHNRMHNITAFITHPNKQYFGGFDTMFEKSQLSFTKIYHNGIIERANDETPLGTFSKIRRKNYLKDIAEDDAVLRRIINNPEKRGQKKYPNLLYKAISNPNNPELIFEMLHQGKRFVPGYEDHKQLCLKIIGPCAEKDKNGKNCLKYFSKPDITKNGHSISLMLGIGKLKLLLGANLNEASENYLFKKHTGKDPGFIKKKLSKENDPIKIDNYLQEVQDVILKGKKSFKAHIYKMNHQIGEKLNKEFLQSINPVATILSSGEKQGYPHPRPGLIGLIGKCSSGETPLVFSTDIAYSANESLKKPYQIRKGINFKIKEMARENDPLKKEKIQSDIDNLQMKLEKAIAVLGVIFLRTDGEKIIISQKLEKPNTKQNKWDIHKLIFNEDLEDFEVVND